jgi:hypothetical protein
MSPARSSEAGFTLLELLVYLALAATILAALASGTFVVRRGVQSVVASGEQLEMLDLGLQAFADDVARIERVTVGAADTPRFVFSGAASGMEYVLADRPRPSVPALMRVRLTVRQDSKGAALVRERMSYDPMHPEMAAGWTDETTLVQGGYRMALAYRGGGGGDGPWVDEWTDSRRLPHQIQLTIADRRTGRAVVPPLTAVLLIDAEPQCISRGAAGCTIASVGELSWRTP